MISSTEFNAHESMKRYHEQEPTVIKNNQNSYIFKKKISYKIFRREFTYNKWASRFKKETNWNLNTEKSINKIDSSVGI